MDTELSTRQARELARRDMRDDVPRNPYAVNSPQYWAYAEEVHQSFTEELRRAV